MTTEDRSDKQLHWEQGYIDNVKRLFDIGKSMEEAVAQYAAMVDSKAANITVPNPASLPFIGNWGEVGPDYDVRQNSGVSAAQLNSALGSTLKNKGDKFIEVGVKYGIDPAFLAAVSMHETGNGTSDAINQKNNVAGMMRPEGGLRTFASIDEGIEAEGSNLKRLYIDDNLVTIAQIQKRYAPLGAANDPTNLNSNWTKGVIKYLGILGVTSGTPNPADIATVSLKNIPIATISNGFIVPPKTDRKSNQTALYALVKTMSVTQFATLDSKYFSFPNGQHSNMFFPHFAQILYLIYRAAAPALGVDRLVASSGMRTKVVAEAKAMGVKTVDPHMAGIACDFALRGEDRFKLADAAWGIGIRAIGVGATHVHIDAGPAASWREHDESRVYYGPGRFE